MVCCNFGDLPSNKLDVEEMKVKVDKSLEAVNSLARKVAMDREAVEKASREIAHIDARLAVLKKGMLQNSPSLDPWP